MTSAAITASLFLAGLALLITQTKAQYNDENALVSPSSSTPSLSPVECCDTLFDYEEKFYVGFAAPTAPRPPTPEEYDRLRTLTFDFALPYLGPVWEGYPNELLSYSIERMEYDDCRMEENIDFIAFFVGLLYHAHCFYCDGAGVESGIEILDEEDMRVCRPGCDHDFCFDPYFCHYRHLRLNKDDYLNRIRTELSDTPFAYVESLSIGSSDGYAETILPCETEPTVSPTEWAECCDPFFYFLEGFYVAFTAPTALRDPTLEEYERLKDLTFSFSLQFLGPVWPGKPNELHSYSIERTEYENCSTEDNVDFIVFIDASVLEADCKYCPGGLEGGVSGCGEREPWECPEGCDAEYCGGCSMCHYRHLRLHEDDYLARIRSELSDTPFAYVDSISIGNADGSAETILPCEAVPTVSPAPSLEPTSSPALPSIRPIRNLLCRVIGLLCA